MRISFGLSEILFILSGMMFLSSLSVHGWVFFSIACLAGIGRLGLEQNDKIKLVENFNRLQEYTDKVSDIQADNHK